MNSTSGPPPLNWARNDEQTRERKRLHYTAIIRSVLLRHGAKPDLQLRLELGARCNASSKGDREIWITEVNRQLEARAMITAFDPNEYNRNRLAAIDRKLKLDRHWHWLTLEEARFLREQLRQAEAELAQAKKEAL